MIFFTLNLYDNKNKMAECVSNDLSDIDLNKFQNNFEEQEEEVRSFLCNFLNYIV
jgi:hypothetical protein